MIKNLIKVCCFGMLLLFMGACTNNNELKFTPLFNGENWDGWYFKLRNGDEALAKKVFSIEDGMVHVYNDQFPDTIDLDGENDTHGLFYTHKKYRRFILRFEYKWGAKIANNFKHWHYDAGCYYHVVDDKIWPVGLEYQIRYNHKANKNHSGDYWASVPLDWYAQKDSSVFLHPNEGGLLIENKKGEVLAKPTNNYHALDGQWNKCEVIVMEDKYSIQKLNGEIVNIATNLKLKGGKIGFQSETAEVYYRNIEIAEFEELVPMEEFIQ
ncbi:3-keto-disaccharide hydrolase [Labilibacter marinus]|uniref:3-keto-disaccharide hydrolase n=1 Tax=Labilibacter marinus TaxID=1477105 RepID=UPI0009FB1053|nr:DUF1080 domain-containing protein [Labilibacter marinus]